MKPEVRSAVFEWLASFALGWAPLIAHGLTFALSDHHADTSLAPWTIDIIFMAITTSGTSAISIFIRLQKGVVVSTALDVGTSALMALTLLFFVLSGTAYGMVASGHSISVLALLTAIALMVAAGVTSIYFELAMARAMVALGTKSAASGP